MGFFDRTPELYLFSRGAATWRYTSDDRDVIVGQSTYAQAALKRGAISESADLTRNTLDINAPESLPLLQLFKPSAPLDLIQINLLALPKGATTPVMKWSGLIGSVTFATGGKATIHCLPPSASLKANGLTRAWQKSCPHTLGDSQCMVSMAAFKVTGTLTSVQGNVIQAAAFASKPDGWFAGGYILWPDGVNTQRRFVLQHTGQTLTLLTPALCAVGTVVDAYPGCDHTLATCATKFGNDINYGGQPWIPDVNPFGSNPVF